MQITYYTISHLFLLDMTSAISNDIQQNCDVHEMGEASKISIIEELNINIRPLGTTHQRC